MNSCCSEAKGTRIFIYIKVILNVTFKKHASKHNTSTVYNRSVIKE